MALNTEGSGGNDESKEGEEEESGGRDEGAGDETEVDVSCVACEWPSLASSLRITHHHLSREADERGS